MDIRKTAYNAGLEIRYAIAASKVDPIQHIPEVDAIIERRLIECRREALEEAAKLIEEGFDRSIKRKVDTCLHGKFEWEDCESCAAAAIRAISYSSPTLLQEQKDNAGKEAE